MPFFAKKIFSFFSFFLLLNARFETKVDAFNSFCGIYGSNKFKDHSINSDRNWNLKIELEKIKNVSMEGSFGVVKVVSYPFEIRGGFKHVIVKEMRFLGANPLEIEAMIGMDKNNMGPVFYGCQFDSIKQKLYIVMEKLFLDFWEKDIMLFCNKIPKVLKYEIYYQLISSIVFLYENGYTHHDIKIENIMFNMAQDQVFLIDYGMARLNQKESMSTHLNKIGTLFYNSPPKFVSSYREKSDLVDDLYQFAMFTMMIESKYNERILLKGDTQYFNTRSNRMTHVCENDKGTQRCIDIIKTNAKIILEEIGGYPKSKANDGIIFTKENINFTDFILSILGYFKIKADGYEKHFQFSAEEVDFIMKRIWNEELSINQLFLKDHRPKIGEKEQSIESTSKLVIDKISAEKVKTEKQKSSFDRHDSTMNKFVGMFYEPSVEKNKKKSSSDKNKKKFSSDSFIIIDDESIEVKKSKMDDEKRKTDGSWIHIYMI